MTFRWSAIQSALNTAAHPTTPEPEALSALRKANELLGKSGRSVGDLILKGDDNAPPATPLATQRRIDQLEDQLARCRTAGIELRDENTRLQSGRAAYEAKIRSLTDELRVARAAKPQPDQTAEIERLKKDLDEAEQASEGWKRLYDNRKQDLDQARKDLAAARKAQPAVNPHLQREYAVLRKTVEHLRETVSDRIYEVCKSQGEAYADEIGIVGDIGWLRRSPSHRKTGVHTGRPAKPI